MTTYVIHPAVPDYAAMSASDTQHNEGGGHVQCMSLSLCSDSSLYFFSQLDFDNFM